jgi:hypothetical protein
MANENKRNLQYFEGKSMKGLFDILNQWQIENEKRFLSINIQETSGLFCCIALTNPAEVMITSEDGKQHAQVDTQGRLFVHL